jgi:hypothetical protein
MGKRREVVDRVTVLRALAVPDRRAVLDLARDLLGGTQSLMQRIQAIMDDIDQDALYQQEESRYTFGVWDHESPINGVPADIVRAQHLMSEEDGAYWIALDGRVFIFQPVKGVRDEQQLAEQARAHIHEMVIEAVRMQVIDQVERQLLE